MDEYPRVTQDACVLTVQFAPASTRERRQPLRMVLDFGSSGEVIGIEIINLVLEVGKSALETISRTVPTAGEHVRYAYDEESDCFWLQLNAGYSRDQKAVDGQVSLDEAGRITAIVVEWHTNERHP